MATTNSGSSPPRGGASYGGTGGADMIPGLSDDDDDDLLLPPPGSPPSSRPAESSNPTEGTEPNPQEGNALTQSPNEETDQPQPDAAPVATSENKRRLSSKVPHRVAMRGRGRSSMIGARSSVRGVKFQYLPRAQWRSALRCYLFPDAQQTYAEYFGLMRPTRRQRIAGTIFEYLMFFFLLGGLVVIAALEPEERMTASGTDMSSTADYFQTESYRTMFLIESVLVFVYLLEIVLRWMAIGFRASSDFLHWCDNIIVFSALLSVLVEFGGYQNRFHSVVVLRSMRLVAPLAQLKSFPSIAVVVSALTGCIYRLLDVTLLFLLFLILMALTAVSLFSRRLRTQCVNDAFMNETIAEAAERFYNLYRESVRYAPDWAEAEAFAFLGNTSSSSSPSTPAPTQTPSSPPASNRTTKTDVGVSTRTVDNYLCGGWFDRNVVQTAYRLVDLNQIYEGNYLHHHFPPALTAALYNLTRMLSTPAAALYAKEVLSSFVVSLNGSTANLSFASDQLWSEAESPVAISDLSCSPEQRCHDTTGTLLGGYHCPFGYSCMEVGNPYNGYVGFDNIGASLLTIFSAETQQLWYEVACMARDSTDTLSIPFFVVVVIVGAFLIVSLLVVLITVEFETVQTEEAKKLELKREAGQLDLEMDGLWTVVTTAVTEHFNRSLADGDGNDDGGDEVRQDGDGAEVTRNTNKLGARRNENCAARIRRARQTVGRYVTGTQWFAYLSSTIILANVAVLATLTEDISKERLAFVTDANFGFSVAFTVEVALRMFGSSDIFAFFKDKRLLLDTIVIIGGWIDMNLTHWNLAWLRVLRILHVFKMLEIVPKLYHWIHLITRSIRKSPVVLALMSLLLVVFAIACMQVMGGMWCNLMSIEDAFSAPTSVDNTIPGCPLRPRPNFDSFGMATIASFQILTADSWNNVMYYAMEARGSYMGPVFAIFFYISNFIFLSVLVGVMLSVRDDEAEKKLSDEVEHEGETVVEREGEGSSDNDSDVDDCGLEVAPQPRVRCLWAAENPEAFKAYREQSLRLRKFQQTHSQCDRQFTYRQGRADLLEMATSTVSSFFNPAAITGSTMEETNDGESPGATTLARHDSNVGEIDVWLEDEECKSFRTLIKGMLETRIAMILSALANLVCLVNLAAYDPIAAPNAKGARVSRKIDVAVMVYFAVEILLKGWTFGFLGDKGQKTFLRSSKWNIAESLLAVLGLITILMQTGAKFQPFYPYLIGFQSLRILLVSRLWPAQHILLKALAQAMYTLRYVLLAGAIIYFSFAVAGLVLLRGKMNACQAPAGLDPSYGVNATSFLRQDLLAEFAGATDGDTPTPSITRRLPNGTIMVPWRALDKESCLAASGQWSPGGPNFDNIAKALYSLFIVSTLEEWSDMMYRAMDYAGPDRAPRTNANIWISVFFIVFAVLSGFLMTNIFTTVLIDSYNRQKRSASAMKTLMLAHEHQGWLVTNRRILRFLPAGARNSVRKNRSEGKGGNSSGSEGKGLNRFLNRKKKALKRRDRSSSWKGLKICGVDLTRIQFKLRTVTRTERFIFASLSCVLINCIFLCLAQYPEPPYLGTLLSVVNIVFTVIFTLEAAVKIFAESFRVYIASQWNRVDLFVVVVSVIGLILQQFVNARLVAFVQSIRVLRLTRLLKGISQLSTLVVKFSQALLSLRHTLVLIFSCTYIAAIAGTRLFGRLGWGSFDLDTFNQGVNMANFGDAMFFLLRLSTGGDWPTLLELSMGTDNCEPRLGNCPPPTPVVFLFYIVFLIFSMYVLRNLLIAVMLDSFSAASDTRGINKVQAALFFGMWQKIDHELSLNIAATDVLPFLRSLPPGLVISLQDVPLRLRIQQELRLLSLLQIRYVHSRNISFRTLVDVICRIHYRGDPPETRDFVHNIVQASEREHLDDDDHQHEEDGHQEASRDEDHTGTTGPVLVGILSTGDKTKKKDEDLSSPSPRRRRVSLATAQDSKRLPPHRGGAGTGGVDTPAAKTHRRAMEYFATKHEHNLPELYRVNAAMLMLIAARTKIKKMRGTLGASGGTTMSFFDVVHRIKDQMKKQSRFGDGYAAEEPSSPTLNATSEGGGGGHSTTDEVPRLDEIGSPLLQEEEERGEEMMKMNDNDGLLTSSPTTPSRRYDYRLDPTASEPSTPWLRLELQDMLDVDVDLDEDELDLINHTI